MKIGLMLPIGEDEKLHLWLPTAALVRELGRAAEVARAEGRIAAHG